ncbi:amidohydrolase family protein [Streptomyces sp. NPDC060035]|uniref:amidohydrolase family protein n=1 Tax=Streptomyces sp. NPDC060035 TaxID=3347044 RepID=UPI003683949D
MAPAPAWWRPLTVVDAKAAEFARETGFREAAAAFQSIGGRRAGAVLQRLAVITFKPEAVVGRRIPTALEFMRRHGFRPVAFRRVRLHRYRARELWRYQWNVATLDRLSVADLLMPACDSLWVAFWDETTPLTMPGTVRFRSLKGPAYPSVRREGQLRYELGGTNRMMTFIHAADEPIDIVRESGVLFDSEDYPALAGELIAAEDADATGELHACLSRLHDSVPSLELDIDAAMSRVDTVLADHLGQGPSPDLSAARHELTRARDGETLDWAGFVRHLESADVQLPLWDRIQIGAQHIRHDEENAVCTIDDDGRTGWLSGRGTVLPMEAPRSAQVRQRDDAPTEVTDVTVVDVAGGRLWPRMTLRLADGRLTPAGRTGDPRTTATGPRRVVDGSGLFLCPGLHDSHVHHRDDDSALYLANGVTRVRNMWGSEQHLVLAAGKDATGFGPRMLTTSPVIDGPAETQASTWPGVVQCRSYGEGIKAATELADEGYRMLKVYGNVTRETLAGVGEVARERGLQVVGHCPGALTFEEAAGLGMSCIEHLENVETGHLLPEYARALRSLGRRYRQLGPGHAAVEALRIRTTGIDWQAIERMADELAASGTAVCPTLSLYRMMFQEPEAALRDPALDYIAPERVRQWHPRQDFRLRDLAPVWPEVVALSRRRLENCLEIVAILHAHGVRIIAGTDAPNPYLVPGFSLHHELSLLVQAGLSPLDALRCATTVPAGHFRGAAGADWHTDDDYLLLDGNPLESLRTLRRPEGLVFRGVHRSRRDLTALLDAQRRVPLEARGEG